MSEVVRIMSKLFQVKTKHGFSEKISGKILRIQIQNFKLVHREPGVIHIMSSRYDLIM